MKALDGIRVLELTQYIAGPVCGSLLADHGAEVIKVEPPAGEGSRQLGPFQNGESLYFAVFNRNKLGITLDLTSEQGRDLFLRLAAASDIVIENFRPGVMDRLGLAYERLAAANPRVILVSISGFGQHGPYRDLPAFDQIVQALSGVMYLNGAEGDPPLKLGISVADYAAGFNGALGALLAILTRENTRRGQHVDVALIDSLVSMLETAIAHYRATGASPVRPGNGRPGSAPASAYACRDGWVYIAATGEIMWRRFVAAIAKPELLVDPRFERNIDRVAHRGEVDKIVHAWTAQKSVEEVVATMRAAHVPAAPVNSIGDLLSDPQILERGILLDLDHRLLGSHIVPGVPVKLADAPGAVLRPAAMLGEHNEQVYSGLLNLKEAEIAQLKAAAVI